MCKAKFYSEQLLSIFNNINTDIEQNFIKLKELDNIQQDLLHIIENNKFSSCEGYMLTKKLKDTRVQRRKVKNEWRLLINLKKSFCDKNISQLKSTNDNITRLNKDLIREIEEKVYQPRALESTDLKLIISL